MAQLVRQSSSEICPLGCYNPSSKTSRNGGLSRPLPSAAEAHCPLAQVITLVPFNNITLKPKEVRKLEIIFAPKKRVPLFSEEVFMESMGLLRPLFLLSGCCQALEVSLDQQHIPFGPVVHQTKATRRILMLNTGDVGTR